MTTSDHQHDEIAHLLASASVNGVALGRIEERLSVVQRDIQEIRTAVVTKAEFGPVRIVTYGLVGLILTGVVGALLSLILRPS